MKKLILVLFLCLSCFSFGEWIIQKGTDEFGDLTGIQYIFSTEKREMGGCIISKAEYGEKYLIALGSSDYIGDKNKSARVRLKIDNLKSITFYGIVVTGKIVMFNVDTKTIELLKKGTELKVSIQKYDGTTILQEYSLRNFAKVFNDFNNSY